MDLRLKFQPARAGADLVLGPVDLEADDSLDTAILMSLGSNARVDGKGGWWGDAYLVDPIVGSRLWTLAGKFTPDTLRTAERYAGEALAWIVNQGLAASVDVVASFRAEVLRLNITLSRPSGPLRYDVEILWSTYGV